ncbi:hypothetical protein KJ750_00930, partial [Patescibacteria group bacterium]|nr:hypothetical protein [Patescibacteria group bacterium]
MATAIGIKRNITLPKSLIKKEGLVILPLEKYEKIKEDLEMIQSKKLLKDIAKARQEIKKGK